MTTIFDVIASTIAVRDHYIDQKKTLSEKMEQELVKDHQQFQRGYQHDAEIRQRFADKLSKIEQEGLKAFEDAVSALETQERARVNSLSSESVKKAISEISMLENVPVSSGEFDVLCKVYLDNNKYMLSYWPGRKLAQIGLRNGIKADGIMAGFDVKMGVLSEIREAVNVFYDQMKKNKEIPARLALTDSKLTMLSERFTNGFTDTRMDAEQVALTSLGLVRSKAVMDAGSAAEGLLNIWKNCQNDELVKSAVLFELAVHPIQNIVIAIADNMGAMIGVESLARAVENFKAEDQEKYSAVPNLIEELRNALVTDVEADGEMSPHVLEVIHNNYNNQYFVKAISSSKGFMANERVKHCMETVSEMQ